MLHFEARPAIWLLALALLSTAGCATHLGSRVPHPNERHLSNIQQLTFGGENAEAYFSSNGKRLIFQSTRPPHRCDQIFVMGTDGAGQRLVSTGKGRTTCAYFYPGQERILYSSTHLASDECPPAPDRSKGYVWAIYPTYEIFAAHADGSALTRLTENDAYDAEATFRPDGGKIVFTSTRDGDLDLYEMDPDGKNVRRLTATPGYDGGAFYSADGQYIVYRASHPTGAELDEYRELLRQNLVRPNRMEIFVMRADGSEQRQITSNGAANFAPYFHPDGKRIIFASNVGSENPRKPEFNLWMVNVDGSGLEQITFEKDFDGFPMFDASGKRLVWCSNRFNGGDQDPARAHDTNVFIADWRE